MSQPFAVQCEMKGLREAIISTNTTGRGIAPIWVNAESGTWWLTLALTDTCLHQGKAQKPWEKGATPSIRQQLGSLDEIGEKFRKDEGATGKQGWHRGRTWPKITNHFFCLTHPTHRNWVHCQPLPQSNWGSKYTLVIHGWCLEVNLAHAGTVWGWDYRTSFITYYIIYLHCYKTGKHLQHVIQDLVWFPNWITVVLCGIHTTPLIYDCTELFASGVITHKWCDNHSTLFPELAALQEGN